MSDFFGQLQGGNIRFPDANINGGGPLPTNLSGPAGINGDPDGRYNFNSDLLSGITPYAYGPGRMGSDRNYQQIPHRMQKIIPQLFLPCADSSIPQLMPLSHAVDQGDVAFILQCERVQTVLFDSIALQDAHVHRMEIPNSTAFINLSTANYLLAGLQRIDPLRKAKGAWNVLADDLCFKPNSIKDRAEVLRLVSTRFVPFGVCAGSEHQGGKHETGLAPVQAAVNHVTTMTVDGQNRDLVNFWRTSDLSAGDNLIYKLEWMRTQKYTLNHYYKGTQRQTFSNQQYCWQLVPDKFEMAIKDSLVPSGAPFNYDYRIHGYWRVAQTFQHRAKYEASSSCVCDDMSYMRGQLLHVTFAPVWIQMQDISDTSDAQIHQLEPASEWKHHKQTKRKLDDWKDTKDARESEDKLAKYKDSREVPGKHKRWMTTATPSPALVVPMAATSSAVVWPAGVGDSAQVGLVGVGGSARVLSTTAENTQRPTIPVSPFVPSIPSLHANQAGTTVASMQELAQNLKRVGETQADPNVVAAQAPKSNASLPAKPDTKVKRVLGKTKPVPTE